MQIELDPVDRITAGAVGPPGSRAFYLQARRGDRLVTLLLEKEQVQLLAGSVLEILSRIGKETGQGPPEEQMNLEEPIVPEWRAGRLSIGYQEERDLLLLEAEEILPEDEEDDEEEGDEEEEGEGAESEFSIGAEVDDLVEEGEEAATNGEGEPNGAAGGSEPGPLDDLGALEDIARLEGLGEMEAEAVEPGRVRLWATREQMLSLARHGATVCAAGRPRCQFCGNPIDPEGHTCPAMNGHRQTDDS
jgi:uncharacterized repeat protein (TIGR03847 family)